MNMCQINQMREIMDNKARPPPLGPHVHLLQSTEKTKLNVKQCCIPDPNCVSNSSTREE